MWKENILFERNRPATVQSNFIRTSLDSNTSQQTKYGIQHIFSY
jgi:hypothetical protein